MSGPLSSQTPGDFQEAPKTKEIGPILGLSPWEGGTWGRPGSCCLQVPCCCHVLRKGPDTHLGGLTSRVFLPTAPHLWSQALGHQHPLVATPHLFPSSLPGLAPEGPLPPASMGVVGPQGAVRDLHTNLYLLENCPQTVLKMDQGPSSLHLTPLPPSEPRAPGGPAPTTTGRIRILFSQSKTQTGPQDTRVCVRPWVAI